MPAATNIVYWRVMWEYSW